MSDSTRARKVAERVKVLVVQGLDHLVKDQRLGFITVTDVRVTGDLQHASVFYTVLGEEQEREDAAEVLAQYRGRLRSHVGKGLGIRLTPTLEFHLDEIPEGAAHLDDVLREARERDEALAQARASAAYAGEEDPYRKPREEAEAEPATLAADGETADDDQR